MTQTPIARTQDFLDTLGVQTHIPYIDGGYANLGNVAADLSYLGIAHVRDGISDGPNGAAPLASYIALAKQGVTFTIGAVDASVVDTASLNARLALIQRLVEAVPGSVTAIEGANEVNNWPVTFNGETGLQAAVDMQKAIYASVHGNPVFKGIAVDYFTGYGVGPVGEGPNPSTTAGLADYDTQHPYPLNGGAPAASINPAVVAHNEPGQVGPLVFTETGYSSNGGPWSNVDQTVQAKYTADLLFDAMKDGVAQTDLYELMDAYAPGSPQGDSGYGLFDSSNTPKPVATALHDITTLLADPGANAATFQTGTFAPTLSGLPATGNDLVLEKSSGVYDIVAWAEPQIWNTATGTEMAAPVEAVSVGLGGTFGSVKVYDPLSGTAPIATLTNASTVQVALSDHPLIIEVADPAPIVAITAEALVNDTGASATDNVTSDGRVTLSGTVSGTAGTTVQIADGQTTLGIATLGPGGSWTYATTLGAGTHALTAVATDTAGTKATSAVAPALQVITQKPQITLASQTLGSDGKTVAMAGSLSGAAGTTITVLNGTTVLGPATLDGKGGWSFTTALAPGTYDLTAKATDPAGNTASVDPPITVPAVIQAATDTLAVTLSEDAYLGDALVTISVDGTQVTGPLAVTAQQRLGQSQTVDVTGNFGTGAHVVGVNFLNDAWGGTPLEDRNIHVKAITFDGVQTILNADQMSQGLANYQVASLVPTADTLKLTVSEDAYLGDAQFTLTVDGKQVGGVETVTAQQKNGATQAFTFTGAFGAGPHSVGVNFLNDLYGGSASTDRNLHVASIALDGTSTSENITRFSQGLSTYAVQTSGAGVPAAGLILTATANATVVVDDTAASATIAFSGKGGTAEFSAAPSFHGAITGLAVGDTLDLRSFGFDGNASLTYQAGQTGGTLTVTDKASTARFALTGPSGTTFNASADGHGGTAITLVG